MKHIISTKQLMTKIKAHYDLCSQCQYNIISLVKALANKKK